MPKPVKKIVRCPVTIAQLDKRISELDKLFDVLDQRMREGMIFLSRADRENLSFIDDCDERIKALEKKVFPNLHRDLQKLAKILPPSGEALNDDLDRPRDKTGKRRPKVGK